MEFASILGGRYPLTFVQNVLEIVYTSKFPGVTPIFTGNVNWKDSISNGNNCYGWKHGTLLNRIGYVNEYWTTGTW